jgi:proline iminopeptidase
MSTSGHDSGRVTSHGLFADIRGGADSAALLFLHGGPGQGCYEFMAIQGDRLGAAVRLIGIDQRGVDRSAPLPAASDLTIADVVKDCESVREALGIGRWAVLGQSFGGMAALRYAASCPAAVTAVIFENPTWDIALSARAALPRVASRLAAVGKGEQSRAALSTAAARDRSSHELWDAYVTALGDLGDAREEYFIPDPGTRSLLRDIRSARPDGTAGGDEPSQSTMRHHHAILADETFYQSQLPLLAELKMPAFLITGGQDLITSPEQRGAFARIPAPHTMREFGNAGHFVHADEPDDYAQAVISFIHE